MCKKLVSFFVTISLVMATTICSYAVTSVSEVKEILSVEETFYVGSDEIRVAIDVSKLSEEELVAIKEYMDEKGYNTIKELLEIPDYTENNKSVVSSIPSKIKNHVTARGANAIEELEDWQYMLVDFGKGGNMEYYAVLGLEVRTENGLATAVVGTDFDCESLPSYGSFDNVRINTYVAGNGASAGMTVNYDIIKTIFAPITDDIDLPLTYTKNEVNYLNFVAE